MVKAPILSPTPPSSTSLSPTNEDQQVALLTGGASTKLTLSTTVAEVTGLPVTTSSSSSPSSSEDQNASSKVKIRINDLVMAESGPIISAAAKRDGEKDCGTDETDYRTAVRNGSTSSSSSGRGGGDSVHLVASKSTTSSSNTTSISGNEFRSAKMSENQKTGLSISGSGGASQYGTPITVALSAPQPPQTSLQPTGAGGQQQQQIPQISPSQGPPPPPQGPHHPHHHLFPVHVISIPQPHPGTAAAAAVTGAWPLVEAPIYVDSNGEPRHYCPAHSQGPAPREHRVLLQLDAGVSLPLQIAGKRKVFRGPTTVQMVSQNRPPPIPVPVQVPQGQVMQQYVNESGTLTHVVLSPTQYQQLHTGQGGVPHIHAPFITANGTTSHFYGPLATGFPGPGGGPHFHPMPGGHMQPQQMSHSPHSPSPPNNYHKDERTQRQHTKLLRKLDQKREMNSAMSTPAHSPSPRKNDLNGLRRTSRNGASSVGTSEDGEESSSVPDEEDDCQTIIEQLSAVQKPEVTDITSRSAMLRWEAPPISENLINSRDLRYDVLLSDRGKEGKYKIIFKGESYVCLIQDLRPGQEYFVCLQVHFEKLQGSASEPTVFTTPSCEPDQPLPPKLIARTKNSLQLRWNAPLDNGSHIVNYILEYDEGKGKEFIEIIKTKGKQYTLNKLQPSTPYSFRLSAVNECGPSAYSDVIAYSTSGNPPLAPKAPSLQSATSNSLRLAWERRAQDEEFILQMADRESGHGFLNMYNGLETSYECKGLKRATSYQFRLRADNEAGSSPWSNDVTYKTQPERPGRPSKPQIKGKIHGTHFKVKWDPPNDRGGADIRKYFLEISSGAKFERVYAGGETEALCDRLSPGTTYQVRVACEGPGGMSGYSDVCTVTSEAVVPGAPNPPYCDNLPGPYAAVLRWDKPDYNGGAPVLEYELQLNGLNHDDEIVYRGKESFCVVKDLCPGEDYQACVRAVNRIGAGAWSENLSFSAGAAPPFVPEAPEVVVRSATHLTVSWKEPTVNGAPILEYRLESSSTDESSDSFNVCYQGLQTTTDIRNLIPYTIYYFRVNASNSAGTSPFSPIVSTQTPAAVPSSPQIKNSEITAHEVTLYWSEPDANGSDILYYVIEYGDKSVATEDNITECTITNLASETSYKFKVQAVNGIGAGQFSNPLKLTTLPPPPKPPKLECTGTGHNFIKLKWGEGRNLDFTNYYVEMYNNRAKEFQLVYSGTSFMCKVNKLQEQTSYVFRICAETDRAGTGDYSDEHVFRTCATLPSSIKAPRVVDTNSNSSTTGSSNPSINGSHSNLTGIAGTPCCSTSLMIEWQHSKNTFADPVEYILQRSCGKDSDYTEIYRGPETRFTLENLEQGSTYLLRVCPVRVTGSGDLMGTFSTPLRYQVPHKASSDSVDAAHSVSSTNHLHHHHHHHRALTGGAYSELANHSDDLAKGSHGAARRFVGKLTAIYSNRKRFSDQEKAILWVIFFMFATVCCAALVKMFMR